MAATLLTLLDDLTLLFDDVATLSRVAAKQTAGVIGDDLALNAEQVTGMQPKRELPVVWAVAKGALLNKAILVPVALLISAFAPRLITPLLMIGGLVLCYEGFGKIWEKWRARRNTERTARVAAVATPAVDMVAFERDRIKGAIRTDFILSAEIIVISLGTMAAAPIVQQIGALTLIGLGVTVLVYGLVAGLVKIDDLGLRWHRAAGTDAAAARRRRMGSLLLRLAPRLMQALSVIGTAAMFLVGGSILAHGIPPVDTLVRTAGAAAGWVVKMLLEGLVGVGAGGVAYLVLAGVSRLRRGRTPAAA